MNSKMTTNSLLSTYKNKNKRSKQLEQEEIHVNGDHMEDYQQGPGKGRMGEKVQRTRSINCRYKIDRRRNSMGNGEAKELICTTHGCDLRWGNAGGRMVQGGGE